MRVRGRVTILMTRYLTLTLTLTLMDITLTLTLTLTLRWIFSSGILLRPRKSWGD